MAVPRAIAVDVVGRGSCASAGFPLTLPSLSTMANPSPFARAPAFDEPRLSGRAQTVRLSFNVSTSNTE